MDSRPLVTEEIEAGAELIREFDKFMPVRAAFWLFPSERSRWLLYIASDAIDDRTKSDGYGEVGRLVEAIRSPHLDLFQVKLMSASDPVAVDILALHERYAGKFPIQYRDEKRFGRMNVEGAYLYPQLAACP
jgi:hypothetical protein